MFFKPRPEQIFPVNMLGPDSFELDGEVYTGKPQSAGREFAPGEKAFVAFTAKGRRLPVILAGAAKRSWMVEGPSPGQQLGEWMQAEGNPFLGRPGLVSFSPTGTFSTLIAMTLDAEDAYGIEAGILGAVAIDGEYVIAHFRGNAALNAITEVTLTARSFVGNAIVWSQSQTLFSSYSTINQRAWLSHLFWDPTNRILTAVGPAQVLSAHIPVGGPPDIINFSAFDSRYMSIAWEAGLRCSPTEIQIYHRDALAQWSSVGAPYSLSAIFPGGVCYWLDYDFELNRVRPWPYYNGAFRVLCSGRESSQQWTHKLLTAEVSGTFVLSTIVSTVDDPPSVDFSAALTAGDIWHQFNSSRPASTTPGATPPYNFPYWVAESPLGPGGFTHLQWGGRKPYGTFLTGYNPLENGNKWLLDGVGIITAGAAEPVEPQTGLSYPCPRPVSNLFRSGDWTMCRWGEHVVNPGIANYNPCFVQDTTGNQVYASIDPVRVQVPSHLRLRHQGFLEPFSYVIPVCPAVYTFPDGQTTCNLGSPSEELNSSTQDLVYYHWPRSEFIHQTVLRKISPTGTILGQIILSPEFTDLQYDDVEMPEQFPVTLTESLRVPENVWDLKLGLQQSPVGTFGSHTDVIFALRDFRSSSTSEPRPGLAIVDRECNSILSALENLAPTDVISAGNTSETGEEIFLGDGANTDFTLSNTPVTAINWVTIDGIPETGYNLVGDTVVFTVAPGDTLEIIINYQYDLPYPTHIVGRYLWAIEGARLALNLGADSGQKWAIVGVWLDNVLSGDKRNDVFLIDVSNLSSPFVVSHLHEINASNLPSEADFDRMVYAQNKIIFPSKLGSNFVWKEFT